MTLSEYLSQVKRANPTLAVFRARAAALEHRIKPVATLEDPFIAAGVDGIPFGNANGSVYRYQISQSIPFPGKLSARWEAALNRSNAAAADTDTMDRILTVLATQSYYRSYFNHKALELNEENIRYISETVESTKARYRSGSATHHDWLLGKVELGILEAQKLRLEREQTALHALLNELRNELPDTLILIEDVRFDRTHETGLEIDPQKLLALQPELKALKSVSATARADEVLAKLSYAPDFVIQAMAMQPRSMGMGEPSNWGIMMGVSLPVYFWRKQSELVRSAQSELESAEAEKRSVENRLNTEIVDARAQLKSALDVVSLYKKNVIPMTEIASKNARTGYAIRSLPLTQLIETLKVERVQRLELLAAQIDAEIAMTRLENLLTTPTILRLAPSRPTLFGSGSGMVDMSGMSVPLNMGNSMSPAPGKKSKPANEGSSSMGGM